MTLLTFARNPDETAFVGVVVDSGKVDYLWPSGSEPRFSSKDRPAPDAPSDEELLTLVTADLGTVDRPMDDFPSRDEAAGFAQEYLDTQPVAPHPLTANADDAFGQIAQDYSGFDDLLTEDGEGEDLDPSAMDNYVMLLMGPIDPEGENGWVFRAVDGEPREGDEDEYLHLPTLADGSAT